MEQQINNEVLDIKLSDILFDEGMNCRSKIAPMDVQDLVHDIKNNGLLSAVVVQKYDKDYFGTFYKYKLIAGFRRYTCHKILNYKTIKATVANIKSEEEARLLNLRENLIRKDLNIMEEAKAVEHLQSFGLTQAKIAAELGKSSGWVSTRLQLLKLPPEIQEQAAAGFLNQYHIKAIQKLPSKELQFEAVRKIKDARLKGNRAPIIKAKKSESSITKRRRDRSEIFLMMEHIQNSIGNNFGTRCMAWCAGEITDNAIYQEIRRIAHDKGRPYVVPYASISSLEGM